MEHCPSEQKRERRSHLELLLIHGRCLLRNRVSCQCYLVEERIDALIGALRSDVMAVDRQLVELAGLNVAPKRPTEPPAYCEDSDWGDYWVALRNASYADYADPAILDLDRRMMQTYAAEAPFPESWPLQSGQPIALTHPALSAGESLSSRLARALFWTRGVLRERWLEGAGPVHEGPAPSKGALHPVELHLNVLPPSGPPGRWGYDGRTHALLRYADSIPCDDSITLFVVLNFSRPLWRYRQSAAYKDVYIEAGHLLTNLRQACDEFGLTMRETEGTTFAETMKCDPIRETLHAFAISDRI